MSAERKKVRVTTLRRMKREGEKIVMMTAHDALSASIVEAASLDVILVGDSLGMTTGRLPKFARRYADLRAEAVKALEDFADQVRKGEFPDPDHVYVD